MSADAGEKPRFRDDADSSTIPPRPPLGGEHGRLAQWFEEAIGTVEHEVKDIRDRLSRMEGAEEARSEWRQGIDHKLDLLLTRHGHREDSPQDGKRGLPRPWWAELLTERTISLLAVVAMAVALVWFEAADKFGIEAVDRSIDHHIGRDVPAK